MATNENENGGDLENGKESMRKLLETGIFGYLEDKVRERLVKDVEVIPLEEGKHILTGSEIHDNVHIVQKGTLKLSFSEEEMTKKGEQKKEHVTTVRKVQEGESLYSLFNIAAKMTGYQHAPIVYAEATEDSTIIRLPIHSIINVALEDRILIIQLLQMMLIRLSSIMRIIDSIPGIQAEVYWKFPADVERPTNSESNKARCIGVAHGAKFSGKQQDRRFQVLLWTRNIIQYDENEPRNTHGLLNSVHGAVEVTDDGTIKNANASIKKLLHLDETDDLQKYISVFKVEPDVEIAPRHCEVMDLVYVVSGTVKLVDNKSGDNERQTEMKEDTLLGLVSVLTGESQQYDIKAGENGCTVALISRESIFEVINKDVEVMLRLCCYQIMGMTNFLHLLDIALGWDFLDAGDECKGILSTDVLFVLTGRLRLHRSENDSDEEIRDYGRGEIIGLEEFLLKSDEEIRDKSSDHGRGEIIEFKETLRQTPVEGKRSAVRDSQVARIPTELWKYFMKKYPEAFFSKFINMIKAKTPKNFGIQQVLARRKFSTVVCIPTSDDVPLKKFQTYLKKAVERYDHDINFEIKSIKDVRNSVPGGKGDGADATERVSDIQIRSFLGSLERDSAIICYNITSNLKDKWSSLLLNQADLVFVVGEFYNRPSSFDSIKRLIGETMAEKALILLHKPKNGSYKKPEDTTWWIDKLDSKASSHFRHFHIRCPKEMFSNENGTSMEGSSVKSSHDVICDDFGRLARYILGRSVGLVLGGGGARGFAHVGIIKAMQEHKPPIPIDVVGGTSMGAFVGAAYSSCTSLEKLEESMKEFCEGMDSFGPYMDLTFPALSVTTGKFFDKVVRKPFGASKFEDLWIPYFNITTDITDSKMTVNKTGTLWEYVRASMSLVLLVPPLCSEKNGHYLLDGGSVNNLPADVMKEEHGECKRIIAVDVGGKSRSDFDNIGTHARGLWLLWMRGRGKNIPGFLKIITRLASITGEDDLKRVQNNPAFDYIRPDHINEFCLMDFNEYDKIMKCGYSAGETRFKDWKE